MIRFAIRIAWRHLLSGGKQTLLITSGVTMAVMLVIFISGLIAGVQARIIDSVTGSIPHIVVKTKDIIPYVASEIPDSPTASVFPQRQPRPFQRITLNNWRDLKRELVAFPHVVTLSPGVSGQGIISYGSKTAGVRLLGALPAEQDKITGISGDIISGDFLTLQKNQAVIGITLAEKLSVQRGDRLRFTSSTGTVTSLRIAAIVATGQSSIDDGWVFVTLHTAQNLFETGTAVTSFSITIDDVFLANDIADQISTSMNLEAESWMRQNSNTLSGLKAQSASSLIISVFSLLAAAFAISSVLIVSVLKRSREIGILKAIGARSKFILLVFTLEGLSISLIGSLSGVALGAGVLLSLRLVTSPSAIPGQAPQPLLPSVISPELLLITIACAIVTSIIASILPAREAAKLDPVEVIRRG